MPITVDEIPDSRSLSGNPPSATLRYKVVGTIDDSIALAYATAASPSTYFAAFGTLYREDVKLDPDGWGQWIATVPYGARTRETGSLTFSFDTTGATVHITAAKQHIASYPIGDDPNPHKGTIGVTQDGKVEGTEIIIPSLKLSYTIRQPMGVITEAYAKLQAAYTGRTNQSTFRGFAGGELLYLGATGSDGTATEAECSYHFLGSSNATGLTVGEISGIVKGGHHYLWIEFKSDKDTDGRASVPPRRVHVERVYDPVDFPTVLGWS
jgi:hypothetical protein